MNYNGKPLRERISLRRPLSTYTKVQKLYGVFVRNKAFQARRSRLKNKQYLNVGCGSNVYPNYINLDYHWRPGLEVCWDLRKPLPFATDSLTAVYTEHCLEHLTLDACSKAIREFERVLKPGSVVRIVVPDAALYIDLYQRYKAGENVTFPYLSSPLPEGITPLMAIAHNFFDHGHLYAYDSMTLGKLLADAGFEDIRQESFMQGRDEVLLIDSEGRSTESLYMEARKRRAMP